ncbi:sugar transferase [Thalassoroseus pseudoceratinae]|uniref:sugar transferase n=1 Tax=Thalassoroseus pseudoceratinae TaxID=2713176 RepID=UPI00141E6DB1|nr:sugar transferase [Thalassoroseus pseudoceratinae]
MTVNSNNVASNTSFSHVDVEPLHQWYSTVKAVADFVLASILIVLLLPVIVVAAVIIRLTSKGPIFYTQTRVGYHGHEFKLIKLRTMIHNAERGTGAVWCSGNDPRITRFGRFLRSSHIDEFPQLLNILQGHMSLVGPRPERPEFVQKLQFDVPFYSERLNVKPGITGLAQLKLPPDETLEDVCRKIEYDCYYVRKHNPILDIKILAYTGWLLLRTVCGMILTPFLLPACTVVEEHTRSLELK